MAGRLLAPAGWLYAKATAWRLAHGHPWKAPVPVICVGNLTAGGAGKTPVVRDLAKRLRERGRNPAVLSRGYGGRESGPLEVEPGRHQAADVGDEPLLLARDTACWIAQDRAAGARAMIAKGIDVIIMDDGLQNTSLIQNLKLVVVDGITGFGNGHAIPAGPLREDIKAGIARADALIVIGDDKHGITETFSNQINCLQANVEVVDSASLSRIRFAAFAGIGRPEKFKASLIQAGADVLEFRGFADHHAFSEPEITRLIARAEELGVPLVTTEKDWVRLDPKWQSQINAIEINISWKDEAAVTSLLNTLKRHG